MRIPLSEVPISVRRLAAQHLASIHGTEMTSGVDTTALAEYAVPIFRPDIDGIAYYEFPVLGPDGGRRILRSKDYLSATREAIAVSDGRRVAAGPVGFVIVSNGRHDFPISHWSLNRLPPSAQVLQPQVNCDSKPAAGEHGMPSRLYRLDALAYAAEDAEGRLIGQTGQLPGLLSGLPHSLMKMAGVINGAVARGTDRNRTDESAGDARHEIERSGPKAPDLKMEDHGDWSTLKARYADAFGPLLDHLRDRASQTWELNDLIEKMGEGIEAGTTMRVALLGPASIELTGPARKFVRADLDDSGSGQPALVLATERARLQTELDLEIHISYASGERESLKYFLVSRDVPSNEKSGSGDNCDCEE